MTPGDFIYGVSCFRLNDGSFAVINRLDVRSVGFVAAVVVRVVRLSILVTDENGIFI